VIESGQRVGPYVVEALLGMGGMGAVYRARDARLGRRVALKVVRRDREDSTGVAPEDRLIAEARAVAALRHPHVVEVYDAGVADGQTYVAMEYVEGKPLRAYVGDASVPLATRKRWLVEIASALGAAHRTGLIHRDVKPENVLIDAEGAARVLDFGLAKRIAHDESAPTVDAPQPETQGGRVVGTVSYMAPEQLAGGPPDPKWDQFSWGLMAYELLTGTHPRLAVPMPGQTAHLTQTPKMPNELAPEIAFSDAAAVMLAMAPDPMRRFASMDAAMAALQNDAPQPPVSQPKTTTKPPPAAPQRRRSPVVVLTVLVVSIGALAVGWAVRHEATSSTPAPAQSSPPSVAIAPSSASPTPAMSPSPSASSPPPASLAASGVASTERRVNARPEDYGTTCTCVSTEDGRLCPRGSDMHRRVCQCTSDDGWSLYQGDSGSQNVTGRDLVDGQPCRGSSGGPESVGKLKDCVANCNLGTFAGVHRTPCRGLRQVDGAEREGLLLCY